MIVRASFLSLAMVLALAGCSRFDPNAEPTYGKESGLPSNCRAYVQYAIDAYRARQYTADETMAGLERNCGLFGYTWASGSRRSP